MDRLVPSRWPVKWRIAATSALLTFLILLGFAFVVGRLAVDKLEANFHEEAQSNASAIANQLEITFSEVTGTRATPRGLGVEDIPLPTGSIFQLVGPDGAPVFPGLPNEQDLGPPPDEPTDVRDFAVASQLIPSQGFGPTVYVQYARSRATLESATDRIWFLLGAGVLAGAALALLAGLAVAGRAMRPIASLTAAAREVATTRDPSRRIPMPETDDEVAELARTLDDMLRQLDAARSETEQMVQAQREFVADASHELRTPLTSIHANLELLQARLATQGEAADTEDNEIVAGALGSSKRMRRLVSDLLLLARADAGRAGPRGACDLAEIADVAIAEARTVADGHTVRLTADGELAVACNPDDMHRLVLNLVENAIRHTPPTTTVDVIVRRDDGQVVIEVEDDGPGLPDLGEQIFSRFVRGAGQADLAADSGTGLGLAIVKAVAVSHGGDVEAGRSPHGGARFTVRLPLAGDDDGSADEAPGDAAERPRGPRAVGERIFSDRLHR